MWFCGTGGLSHRLASHTVSSSTWGMTPGMGVGGGAAPVRTNARQRFCNDSGFGRFSKHSVHTHVPWCGSGLAGGGVGGGVSAAAAMCERSRVRCLLGARVRQQVSAELHSLTPPSPPFLHSRTHMSAGMQDH